MYHSVHQTCDGFDARSDISLYIQATYQLGSGQCTWGCCGGSSGGRGLGVVGDWLLVGEQDELGSEPRKGEGGGSSNGDGTAVAAGMECRNVCHCSHCGPCKTWTEIALVSVSHLMGKCHNVGYPPVQISCRWHQQARHGSSSTGSSMPIASRSRGNSSASAISVAVVAGVDVRQ